MCPNHALWIKRLSLMGGSNWIPWRLRTNSLNRYSQLHHRFCFFYIFSVPKYHKFLSNPYESLTYVKLTVLTKLCLEVFSITCLRYVVPVLVRWICIFISLDPLFLLLSVPECLVFFMCVSFLCACMSQKVRLRTQQRCIFMIACVFSCVPLIIHRCCKKPTIIVVSFLFFSFHKDLSTARGALRLLLGSQILLFLFSLPANPPSSLSFLWSGR